MDNIASIFEFENYRDFVKSWLQDQPKKGHGQLRKIALHLRMAPVTITQIFRGDRELPIEMAPPLAGYLKLNALERKFLIKLVMRSRAGSQELLEFLNDEIEQLRKESQSLKNRLPSQINLKESDLARFHSSWIYSAVRLLTSIEGFQSIHEVARKLGLKVTKTEAILTFLVETGLCIQENGNYTLGPQKTHLPEESPFIVPRQLSWRNKAMTRMNDVSRAELFYTAPMTMSKNDVPIIRQEIIKFIEKINEIIGPSPAEELVCLNVDWFVVAADPKI